MPRKKDAIDAEIDKAQVFVISVMTDTAGGAVFGVLAACRPMDPAALFAGFNIGPATKTGGVALLVRSDLQMLDTHTDYSGLETDPGDLLAEPGILPALFSLCLHFRLGVADLVAMRLPDGSVEVRRGA